MQPLDALFSKPEQRLLAQVLAHPERDFGTLELLRQMGNSRGAGSKVLDRWAAAGLLLERRVGNQRRFAANKDFLLYPELRRMVLKTVALTEPLAQALAPLAGKLTEAFVFGSVAAGRDHAGSDIDLALVGEVDLFDVSPLLDPLQADLGRPVHASVYSQQDWASDNPVLRSIRQSPRIDLMEALHGQTR